jgi:hypothetical protein
MFDELDITNGKCFVVRWRSSSDELCKNVARFSGLAAAGSTWQTMMMNRPGETSKV